MRRLAIALCAGLACTAATAWAQEDDDDAGGAPAAARAGGP